ncbi:hypothetical protein GCM10011607_12720 [Shewanella inventionis]|uniref:Uncharacterized protein n=1 Tax=Shewanella inventionis TaxID=1738770 RepID=A0ABQ1IWH8_9GAMM|nr:hypothetical protein [Shewanella inventionis]GGB53606.1 hypothetical protein GCM10011607_12720 [Shewanella inventionis]
MTDKLSHEMTYASTKDGMSNDRPTMLNEYLAHINTDKDIWDQRLIHFINGLPPSLVDECLAKKPNALLTVFIIDDLYLFESSNNNIEISNYLNTVQGFNGSIPFHKAARIQHLQMLFPFAYFLMNITEGNLKAGNDTACFHCIKEVLEIIQTEVGLELITSLGEDYV